MIEPKETAKNIKKGYCKCGCGKLAGKNSKKQHGYKKGHEPKENIAERKKKKRAKKKAVKEKPLKKKKAAKGKKLREQIKEKHLCTYARKDGEPCGRIRQKGKNYCPVHNPDLIKGDSLDTPLHFIRSVKKDGKPFEIRWFEPYMYDVYASVAPYRALIKSAQVGISEEELMRVFWFIKKYGLTARRRIIWTLPTATDVEDFSKDRFDSIIEENWRLFGSEDEKKKWVDNVRMKRIANSLIFMRGTQGKARNLSTPSDLNIHDEVNFSDPVQMTRYASRQGNSEFKWVSWVSTPTFPGVGVDEKVRTTCNKHWHVPCSKCGTLARLCCEPLEHMDLDNNIWACKECAGELDRKAGFWVSENPELEGKRDGWHITMPMRLDRTPQDIMDEKKNYKMEGDWYNFSLGLAFEATSNQIKDLALAACTKGNYKFHEKWKNACTAGVDQSSKWHHIVVSTWDAKGRRQVVWAEKVDVEESFDSTLPLLMQQFNIVVLVIDGNPNQNSAKKFAKEYKGRIFIHGNNDKMFEDAQWKEEEHRVVTNKTQIMDQMSDEIKHQEVAWPDNAVMNEVKSHIRNMRRRASEEKNIAHWVNVGEDHFSDALMLDYVAKKRASEYWQPHVTISAIDISTTKPEDERMALTHALTEIQDTDEIFSYFVQKNRSIFVENMVLSDIARKVFTYLEKTYGVRKTLEVTRPGIENAKYLREMIKQRDLVDFVSFINKNWETQDVHAEEENADAGEEKTSSKTSN